MANLKKAAAVLILKTRDMRKLPQTTLDGVLEDFTCFLQAHIDATLQKTLEMFKSFQVAEEVESSMTAILQDEHLRKPFQGLDSEHRQHSFFRDHFGMVVSST